MWLWLFIHNCVAQTMPSNQTLNSCYQRTFSAAFGTAQFEATITALIPLNWIISVPIALRPCLEHELVFLEPVLCVNFVFTRVWSKFYCTWSEVGQCASQPSLFTRQPDYILYVDILDKRKPSATNKLNYWGLFLYGQFYLRFPAIRSDNLEACEQDIFYMKLMQTEKGRLAVALFLPDNCY